MYILIVLLQVHYNCVLETYLCKLYSQAIQLQYVL
jgi:hypothetical protein